MSLDSRRVERPYRLHALGRDGRSDRPTSLARAVQDAERIRPTIGHHVGKALWGGRDNLATLGRGCPVELAGSADRSRDVDEVLIVVRRRQQRRHLPVVQHP